MSRPRIAAGVLAAACLLLAPLARGQCAMCRASIEHSEEGRRLSGELNQAILVMFLAPYLVFGSCTALLFRRRIASALRERIRFAAGGPPDLPEETSTS